MRAHRVLGWRLEFIGWRLAFIGCLAAGSIWAQQYVISTVAGGAPPATPGPALKTSIGDPTRLAADPAGNLYFSSLHSIFKVDATGALTRFAQNTVFGVTRASLVVA